MSQAIQQILAELASLDAHAAKVVTELTPVTRTFTITRVSGIFADDTDVQIGDVAHVTVLRGRIGQLNTDGIFNDIAPNTVIEYWVTRGAVSSNKALEGFYG